MTTMLPRNWEEWSLGDVGEWLGGGTPSSSNAAYWNGDIPWVSPKDMKVAVIVSTQDNITRAALESSAAKLIPRGSVLFVTRSGILAHSFPVATTRHPVTVNQDLKAIAPVEVINPEYLAWALRARERQVLYSCSKHGTTVHSIEIPALKTMKVPIAPPAEQQRIVVKIEELFSELDSGVASLTTARERLKGYWESVLTYAFQAATDFRALPELLAQPMSNGYSGKPVQGPTRWKVLSLSATTSGVFSREHFKYLDEPGLEVRDIWCEPDDILVQRGNTKEYVGVPAIYTGAPREFVFPDLMIRLRANRELILPAYLWYALSSPRIRNEMRRRAKGSAGTMPKINQKILSELQMPYCSPNEQRRVVERLDALMSHTRVLDEEIRAHLSRVGALRAAILRRAFSGQLVRQNPKDEAASVLLDRIRAKPEGATTEKAHATKNGRRDAA